MAGVKGRSGGKREGAGRKPALSAKTGISDAKAFLEGVLRGEVNASPSQVKAATALLPFQHVKLGEGGKKDERADKAKKAATGKFSAAPAPLKLVSK